MQWNNGFLENAKKNSIGADKKEVLKTSKKTVPKKLLASLFAVLIAVSMSACNSRVVSIAKINNNAVNLYFYNVYDELTTVLEENGMGRGGYDNTYEQFLKIKDYLKDIVGKLINS